MQKPRGMGSFLVAMFLATQVAVAEVITLDARQDNTLYEHPTGGLSNGAGDHMFAGPKRCGPHSTRPGGFRFAGSIPAPAVVNSVQLTLNATTPRNHSGTIRLYRLLSAWEGGLFAAEQCQPLSPGQRLAHLGVDCADGRGCAELVGRTGDELWLAHPQQR